MKIKKTIGEAIFDACNYTFLLLLSLSILYPFIQLLNTSLSNPDLIMPGQILWFPKGLTLNAYKNIFQDPMLYSGYGNTLYRTIFGTATAVLVTILTAYPLSKRELPYRKFFTALFLFTMFFQGGIIPEYLLIKNLGLINNRLTYIIPHLVQIFDMIIMRNFFMSLPSEMEESAKIDGAGEFRTLFQIIIPLSLPVIATVTLWIAVSNWNAWFDSMLYFTDPSKQVVQIYLRRIVVQATDVEVQRMMEEIQRESGIRTTPETIKAAVLMVTTIPIVCVYPFVQKYFVKGVMVGSVKG